MHLLYLDASGTPEQTDPNSKHFVLVGLGMQEAAWFALDRRIQDLKARYCFPGDDPDRLEIHVKQFAGTIREQDDVPGFDDLSPVVRRAKVLDVQQRKIEAEPTSAKKRERRDKYRPYAPFVHLIRGERSQLLEDAIDLIAGHDGIRLFGEAVGKTHPAVQGGRTDPLAEAFTQVVSRFDQFLKRKDIWKHRGRPGRRVDHGLLILDQDASTETVYERLFRNYRRHGFPFDRMTHVIDVPFFASSAKVGGLQLADVAAYVVRRYVDKGATAGSHEERLFRKLLPKFDRGTSGRLHGLRHFAPPGMCQCLICKEYESAPPG